MTTTLKNIHLAGSSLLPSRYELVRKLPRNGVVAEIGVAEGDFSMQIFKYASPAKLHLIDLWDPEYNYPYLPEIRDGDHCYETAYSKFVDEVKQEKVVFTRSDSLAAAQLFSDNYFDWIYIDTTHSYKRTLNELCAYKNKVKQNGVICGHDYIPGNINRGIEFGVIEAVKEFCVNYNFRYKFLTVDRFPSFAIERIS